MGDESRQITVCPECDQTNIRPLVGNATANAAYYCRDCGHRFEEPAERTPKVDSGQLPGYAGTLADADPDDIP